MPPKEKDVTITEQTRMPLALVISIVGLAILFTIGWADLRHQLGNTLTTPQMQEWLENAREQNPSIKWPRIPQKQTPSAEYQWQPIYYTRRNNE